MFNLQFFSRPIPDTETALTEYGYDGSMTVEPISDTNLQSALLAHAEAMDCIVGEVLVIVTDSNLRHVKSAFRFEYSPTV